MLAVVILIFGAAAALAAEGEVSNLRSTSHTLNTIDQNSQKTKISMAWTAAAWTGKTLAGYNYKFSTSASDTLLDQMISGTANITGIDSASYTGKNGQAYYFYIKAFFTDGTSGATVKKGPYYIDDTAPLNTTVSINAGGESTSSINVTLALGGSAPPNNPGGPVQMYISNTNYGAGGAWETFANSKAWTLTTGNGTKTVYVQFKDLAGNISQANDTITLAVDALSVSSSQTEITVGGDQMTFTRTGGVASYTWAVIEEKNLDGTDAGQGNVAAIDSLSDSQCLVSAVGPGTFRVRVTDGASSTATSQVKTVTELTVSPVSVTLSKSQTQQFTASYGTPPYSWSILASTADGCLINSSGLFTASSSNTGVATVRVTDSRNQTADASVNVTSASLAINAGNSQSVTAGAQAANLEIKITADGSAADYVIDFAITADPTMGDYTKASFSPNDPVTTYQALTDVNGDASAPLYVGQKAGTYTITATCTNRDGNSDLDTTADQTPVSVIGSPRTFTLTATAGGAATISYVSGNGQTGTPATALTNPFVVLVTDAYDNPVLGTTVTFAVTEGTGSLSASSVTTGSDGKTSTTLTPSAGTNTVTATATGLTGSPVTFSASGGEMGDVDGSGVINVFDVVKVARASLGLDNTGTYIAVLADLTGDGNINVFDVVKVARLSLGLD
jgi:uncharacterized protein (DUF2141 family)